MRGGANDGGEEGVDGGFKRGGGLEFVLGTTSIDEDITVSIREERKQKKEEEKNGKMVGFGDVDEHFWVEEGGIVVLFEFSTFEWC